MKNYEQTRNVLVAIDVQNDFINGSLAVNKGVEVVEPINQLAQRIRSAMGKVALTRDWHPAITPHFVDYGGIWPIHGVANTEGAAFHSGLDVKDEDIIISKGMGQTDGYSAMEGVAEDGTTLESLIKPKNNLERVQAFLTGLTTDFCGKDTVIGAVDRFRALENVEIYAIPEAMRPVNLHEGDEDRAITEMEAAGAKIITLEQAFALIDTTRIE